LRCRKIINVIWREKLLLLTNFLGNKQRLLLRVKKMKKILVIDDGRGVEERFKLAFASKRLSN